MRLSPPAQACLAGLFLASVTRAALQDALVARQVLADVADTCVVRIDFAAAPAARPPVYATAFSLEHVFWLYAPELGTRVLGPATRAWPDPAALSARLHRLDPGIRRVTVYANPVAAIPRPEQLYLNNACVIASLHALTRVLDSGVRVAEAGLILMSFDTSDASSVASAQVNHSLLAYRRDEQWWCIDPNNPLKPFRLESAEVGAPLDPALVLLALQQNYPVKSVYLLALSRGTLDRIAANVVWRSLPASGWGGLPASEWRSLPVGGGGG
jgi:hypothetical protein